MSGYVKTYRAAMDHAVFQDPWLWKVFSWCVMRANFKDFNSASGLVKRGSFTTGRIKAGDELHMSPSRVYRLLHKLQELGSITISANSNWTTVTVCNYETYQGDDQPERTADEQPADSQRTADEQRMNTRLRKQERKNVKKARNEYTQDFLKFWESFPPIRKGSKPAAFDAWRSAIEREQPEAILASVEEFAASWLAHSEFCPGPAPWLNNDRWDDDRRSWQERKQSQSTTRPMADSINGLGD